MNSGQSWSALLQQLPLDYAATMPLDTTVEFFLMVAMLMSVPVMWQEKQFQCISQSTLFRSC